MDFVNFAGGILLTLAGVSALAQVPSMTDPVTGARAGHEPGVGESLPRSEKAGNILERQKIVTIANTLPDPGMTEDALPVDYLRAARASLLVGHTGQAQQSLEMAETRALNTTIAIGQDNVPTDRVMISRIKEALQTLGRGDSPGTIKLIDVALAR